eukprot:6901041-Ditylum_brightwellii.AAC.1
MSPRQQEMVVTYFCHLQSAYLGRPCLQGSKKQLSHIFAICSQRTLLDYVSKASAYLCRLHLQGSKKRSPYIFTIRSQRTLVDYVSKAASNSTS